MPTDFFTSTQLQKDLIVEVIYGDLTLRLDSRIVEKAINVRGWHDTKLKCIVPYLEYVYIFDYVSNLYSYRSTDCVICPDGKILPVEYASHGALFYVLMHKHNCVDEYFSSGFYSPEEFMIKKYGYVALHGGKIYFDRLIEKYSTKLAKNSLSKILSVLKG